MFRCGTQPLGLLLLLLFGLEVTALAECPWGCTCNSLIVNCSGRQLQQFPSDIPLITRRLILADNNLLELPPLQLNFLSDLVYLDCRNNSITEVSEAAFINILKLVYIDLSYNELTIITDWTFELLVNLVVLKIANNPGLSEIEKDAFSNNTGLRELDLSGNNLTHLDVSALSNLPALRAASLGGNPWDCFCLLEQLSEWMRSSGVNILDASNVVCNTPDSLRGVLVSEAGTEIYKACHLIFDYRDYLFLFLIGFGIFTSGTIVAWLAGIMVVIHENYLKKKEIDELEGEMDYTSVAQQDANTKKEPTPDVL
uniref:Leucine rich repeat containing 52 n=1 Tax=Latimeria chalumnae TaxID=7897 RepID=H3ARE5_LATCH